nr:MAG TPA: Cytosine specific methyltransferase [Caudoviricetes sp.]
MILDQPPRPTRICGASPGSPDPEPQHHPLHRGRLAMTRIIDLCAGSGMLAHAAAYAAGGTDTPILSIDIDPAALAVCAAHGHTVWERDLADITDGEAAGWDADIICGGTPCQSVSVAGTKQGVEGPSSLVREWLRLVSAASPRGAVWENVHGATLPRPGWPDGMLSYVRGTLIRCGYRVRWTELRADEVGLMHRRSRVFLVAIRQNADVPRHAQPTLRAPNTHRGALTPQASDSRHAGVEDGIIQP